MIPRFHIAPGAVVMQRLVPQVISAPQMVLAFLRTRVNTPRYALQVHLQAQGFPHNHKDVDLFHMVNSPHTGQCVLEALYSTHKSDLADAQAGWPGWPFDGSLEARAFHQEQWALSWTTVVLSYADCIATGNPEAFAAFKVPFTPFGTLHPTQRMFEACAGLSDEFVCFPSLSPSPSQG